ncbi:MAG: hypothetical protein GXP06_02520 [Alphaproteobacteria bacterium]|nr:hypothetical protein [Alphaproteobacteria bacterium]
MKTGGKATRLFEGLSNGVRRGWSRVSAVSRFSTKTMDKAEQSQAEAFYAPLDPTIGLYGGRQSGDDETAQMPLSMLLEKTAHDMVARRRALRERADDLILRIGQRAEGEITLATQALRFLIGGAWVGVAAWLYVSAGGVSGLNLSSYAAQMPAADALVLTRVFFVLGAAGIGVALAVAALVGFTGNGRNQRVRDEATQLGQYIAETARDFDADLTHFRNAMNSHNNPADAVRDLSRAHLTALGAQAYFREIEFLTAEGDDAAVRFRGFLKRKSEPVPAGPVFLLGFLLGAIVIAVLYVPRPDLPAAAPPEIAQYPWAAKAILLGGALYAGVGVLLSAMGGLIAGGVAGKARGEALDALRSAFTAREAPRPADIVRRIEDAVDVFQARVSARNNRSSGKSNQTDASGSSFSADDDEIPPWRRRDSSAKFVDTGFQAAPATWRTDAFGKNFAPDPEAKRGLLGFKKPRRD